MLSAVRSVPRWANVVFDVLVALIVVAITAGSTYTFFQRTATEARTVHHIWVEPVVVKRGGKITIKIHATIHLPCKTQVQRWLVPVDTKEPVLERVEPGRTSETGEHVIPIELQLDPSWEGTFYYKSIVYDICELSGGAKTFVSAPNFVYFQIVD
jgi:hypothetical protein